MGLAYADQDLERRIAALEVALAAERVRADAMFATAEKLKAERDAVVADAERYRRLGVLVHAGAWGVSIGEHEDEGEVWMDDKAHMDKMLDGEWAKEAAQWLAAMQMAARKEGV